MIQMGFAFLRKLQIPFIILLHIETLSPILCRSLSFFLLEKPGKIQSILISHRPGNIIDRKICIFEQGTGLPDTVIQEILLGRSTGNGFEKTIEIGALNIQMISDNLNVDSSVIIVFNISESLLHIGDFFLFGRDVFSWKFISQEI